MIGSIILLALGASFLPMLLACVAIIISLPGPRRLLVAFYAGGMLISVSTGIVVLTVFKNSQEVLGSTRSSREPTLSIIGGAVALLLAWLMSSTRGNALLERWRTRHSRKPRPAKGHSWAERRLARASWEVALITGAVINLPGPFYLLALGKIAADGYSTAQEIALILLFNAIMFVMLEVPLAGYLLAPEKTTKRVKAASQRLNENGLRIAGWLVGFFGLGLLVQGIAALAG